MIKQLGTLGFFIKFNESASSALKFVEVFSSSTTTTSLFSASTSSAGVVSLSVPASIYINGASANTITGSDWNHIMFTFDPKLYTYSENDFIVRFGNSSKGDFNIHNIYILDYYLLPSLASAMHRAFIGNNIAVSASATIASQSIVISDKNESKHSSSVTGLVYQPIPGQKQLKLDVALATEGSASTYMTVDMVGDSLFYDGMRLDSGDYILSLADNEVYYLSDSTDNLSKISTTNGDYVVVTDGVEFGGRLYVKSNNQFIEEQPIEKISFMGTEYE